MKDGPRKTAVDRICERRDVMAGLIALLDRERPRADGKPAPASYFYATRDGIAWPENPISSGGDSVPADMVARFHVAQAATLRDADINFGRRHNVPVGVIGEGGLLVFAPKTWNAEVNNDNF